MKLILPYFLKNRYRILMGVLCMVVVDATQLVIPQVIRSAVDTLAQSGMDRVLLIGQCLFILGLGLVMAYLRYVWRILLMGSARDVEKGLRGHLFNHLLTLDPHFFDRTKTGDIMAHATSDINHVRMAFGFGLIVLVDTLLLGGATLVLMAWTNLKLTLLAMIPMPFLIYFTKTLGQKMHDFHKSAQESFSLLTEMVRESFFGIRVIKVFNFEGAADQKIGEAAQDYFQKNLKRAVVTSLLKPLLGFFFNLSTLIIVFYGGLLVMEDRLTPGELVAFLQYLGLLAWPAIAVGWMINLYQRGMASLGRINGLLEQRPRVRPPETPVQDHLKGGIRFDRAYFSYKGGTPVLQDISLEIRPGRAAGITGPPGSGKTSLAQLILRLYDLTSGRLLLDGKDIRSFDPDHIRKNVAFMSQEPFLFSGTIRENILMGRDLDDNHLDKIIRICHLTKTLDQMPDRMGTVVGERGVTLSGGQKQRVALARTLALPAPVIILDDPVSQLDVRTADRIMSGLSREIKTAGPSLIIISHRLSALAGCDEILIMDQGRIQSRGTHDHLIRSNAFYRESFRIQQFEEAGHVKA